jgi:hypothetical protein
MACLLVGCGGDPSAAACPEGERRICRAVDDCRCGAGCALGDACPAGDGGLAVCAVPVSATVGACVDARWLVGAGGTLQCGADACGLDSACVDWGADGVRCAPPCGANDGCPSGCCVQITDRAAGGTRNVCAPSERYTCLAGAPAGRACEPACAAGEGCAWVGSAPRCLAGCARDADCAGGCCAPTTGGRRVCAPPRVGCEAPLRTACTNLDGCVTVVSGVRGTHCGDIDSVEVRVRNDCAQPADIELCYQRRDGTCACGTHQNVAPQTEASPAFWACDVVGVYRMSARPAGDPEGCHPHACR